MTFGPLRWVLASPAFHRWHHAARPDAYGKNYAGQLSCLDMLFGTMYLPEGPPPDTYGVEDPVPHGYLAQLLHPLKRERPSPEPATLPDASECHRALMIPPRATSPIGSPAGNGEHNPASLGSSPMAARP